MVDIPERLHVLLSQEDVIYRTSDYLARMHSQEEQQQKRNAMDTTAIKSTSSISPKKRKSYEDDECADAQHPSAGKHGNNDDGTASTQINKHWREKICEWAYQVVDHFDLNREVVSIAMNHLDRFLDTFTAEVDKNMFQLLAMTCLYLSIKLNEYKHFLIPESKSSMETILRLSRGAFTLSQMEQMEYEVLQRLRWHVHPPSPQLFVKYYLSFVSIEEHEIYDLTQFMIELSVMDYFFVSYKPSEVAAASLLNALQHLYPNSDARCHFSVLGKFMDLSSPGITSCRERLGLIYAQANDQGVYVAGSIAGKEATAAVDAQTNMHRTTSPVSVMAAPQPYDSNNHNATQYHHDNMDTEFGPEDDSYDDI